LFGGIYAQRSSSRQQKKNMSGVDLSGLGKEYLGPNK